MCNQGAVVSSPPQAQRSRAVQRAKSAIPCRGVRRGERLFRVGARRSEPRYNGAMILRILGSHSQYRAIRLHLRLHLSQFCSQICDCRF